MRHLSLNNRMISSTKFSSIIVASFLMGSTGVFSERVMADPNLSDSEQSDYSGLARLIGCSGALIDTGGPSSAPAYVITNGHCVGFPPPNAVWVNKYSYEEFTFISNTTKKRVHFLTRNIDYATMTGTDLAVIKLEDETIASMREKGILAMRISATGPQVGEAVFRADIKSGLNVQQCTIESIIGHLHEGDWTFGGSFRHACESSGGTSGSPLISQRTGEIVAIHNTSVNKTNACGVAAACEIGDDGEISLHAGKKYAQRTQDLAACFNINGIFDLYLSTCTLKRPA